MDGQDLPERLAEMTRGEPQMDLVDQLPKTAADLEWPKPKPKRHRPRVPAVGALRGDSQRQGLAEPQVGIGVGHPAPATAARRAAAPVIDLKRETDGRDRGQNLWGRLGPTGCLRHSGDSAPPAYPVVTLVNRKR